MRRPFIVAVLLGALVAGCQPRPKHEPELRLFQCRRARGKITIDGKLDEPSWELAQLLGDFRVPRTYAKPQAISGARLLWDDDHLYFACTMEDLDIFGTQTRHDSFTWQDDVCELFLKPSEASHAYYEIHVTPRNTTLDLLIARRGAGSFDRWTPWESGIESAVTIKGTLNNWDDKDKGWIVEAAIPLRAFTRAAPKAQLGDRWRFAVCRYDYSVYVDGPEMTSTARLPASNFHLHEAYDYLEFAE